MKKFVFPRSFGYLVVVLVILFGSLAPTFPVGIAPLKSAPITLAWDAASDSSVQGYGIYYGPINRLAANYINTGTNLSVTLFDLLANTGYWFYAVSYDADGNESVPSTPLQLTPPVLSPMRIGRLAQGGFRFTLRAAPGSVCQLEYADTPNSATWLALGVATADANGNLILYDPAFPLHPARYYRATRLANLPASSSTEL